jgi:alpha-tubulin suppressor-like RCC1 family protein
LKIKNIYCGDEFTFILLENGKLYCFGNNKSGQLGLGDKIEKKTPTELTFFDNMKIKKIICSFCYTIVLLGKAIIKSKKMEVLIVLVIMSIYKRV